MLINTIGWLGTCLYLANHAYISGNSNWKKSVYFTVNFVAASALVVQSIAVESYQAMIINGFWMIVSACLLLKLDLSRIRMPLFVFNVIVVCVLTWVAWAVMAQPPPYAYEVLGWSSAVFFCLSYFLFSSKRISARAYFVCNVYAALALLPQLWITQNWPVFCLELIWAGISVWGVFRTYDQVHLID